MAKTITLVELKIAGMYVDILNQKVIVNYSMHDASGRQWGEAKQEVYWVTLPSPKDISDSLLPPQYLQTLTDLYNAAKIDLEARYLI